ncbi:peptidase M4 family protein [Shewanella sp. 202IG2-18]|uniref:M4 family metallopeptidase n=1 Tax=Parashewanella hymeniacidonis TaxID=2807618 RepID=UPI00195F3206|nr:M4 family metallopeptidase [Parashewanella hymeniacidonis]MBM7074168.1 peptidase M4 family protein [Parashewanella hymeniacidonis]
MSVKYRKSLIAVAVTLCVSTGASAANIVNLTQQTKSHPLLGRSRTMPGAAGLGNSQPQVTLDAKTTYRIVSEVKFKNGTTKYRLQQYYDGVPVYNSTIVSEKSNFKNVIDQPVIGSAVNGLQQDNVSSTPSISEEQAFKVSAANHDESKSVSNINSLSKRSAKLWVFMVGNQPHLAYKTSFILQHGNKVSRPTTLVDAHSGKVLKKWNSIEHLLIGTGAGGNPNTGEYYYGDSKDHPKLDLTVQSSANGKECVFDTPQVRTVSVHNKAFGKDAKGRFVDPTAQYNNQPISYDCSQSTAYQEQEINGAYGVTNDAHAFGTIIYNMYEDWFDQSPLQHRDMFGRKVDEQLLMRVHYGQNFNNAFWDSQEMNFGDGGPEYVSRIIGGIVVGKKKVDAFYPFVTLDVTAHEVSHGFTQYNSGLQGGHSDKPGVACEACSINEAFSDMAGEAAKYFAYGKNNFETGEAIVKDPSVIGSNSIRSLKNPSADGHTVDTEPQYRQMIQDAIDNKAEVDEHAGAGIYDKAFYELATSDNWTTRKAFTVFVDANKLYWHKDTTFDCGARGVIQAAGDNGYSVQDVERAFDAVDVDYSHCD